MSSQERGSAEHEGQARDVILVVHIDPLDPAAERLWTTIGKIAQTLVGEQGWCLVGGLMVQLFAHEAGQRVRPTTDIDILGDARRRPSATEMLAEKLQALGGQLQVPSGVELTDGYQFLVEGDLVEILAPDGLSANTPPAAPAILGLASSLAQACQARQREGGGTDRPGSASGPFAIDSTRARELDRAGV